MEKLVNGTQKLTICIIALRNNTAALRICINPAPLRWASIANKNSPPFTGGCSIQYTLAKNLVFVLVKHEVFLTRVIRPYIFNALIHFTLVFQLL